MKINKIFGREILDSRGNPTVEARVVLECEETRCHRCLDHTGGHNTTSPNTPMFGLAAFLKVICSCYPKLEQGYFSESCSPSMMTESSRRRNAESKVSLIDLPTRATPHCAANE